MKSLTILFNDELNGVTTFNYTLTKAFKTKEGNTSELVVLDIIDNGFKSKFIDEGIQLRTSEINYDYVFINNRKGLKWCIENGIMATKYFYFVHSIPTDEALQKDVFPPLASALPSLLGGKVEVVVFSQKSKEYFDNQAHTTTLIFNGIDLSRFSYQENTPPSAIKKILVFDLRNSSLYKGKLQNLADILPNTYLRSISKPVWEIQEEIKEADIVIAYGRSAIEAMAMGKPVIVYGQNGGDGLVTAENKELLATTNFSGWSVRSLPLPEYLFEGSILQEIQRYNQTNMISVKNFIRTNYGIDTVLSTLSLNAP